jgi:hypothetical protein
MALVVVVVVVGPIPHVCSMLESRSRSRNGNAIAIVDYLNNIIITNHPDRLPTYMCTLARRAPTSPQRAKATPPIPSRRNKYLTWPFYRKWRVDVSTCVFTCPGAHNTRTHVQCQLNLTPRWCDSTVPVLVLVIRTSINAQKIGSVIAPSALFGMSLSVTTIHLVYKIIAAESKCAPATPTARVQDQHLRLLC